MTTPIHPSALAWLLVDKDGEPCQWAGHVYTSIGETQRSLPTDADHVSPLKAPHRWLALGPLQAAQEHPSPVASVDLARLFHETYERLAPSFGYATRADTKQFDPESANGKLMTAVCAELASRMAAPPQPPQGFAIVPIIPTFEMLAAGVEWTRSPKAVYRAMVAAAPAADQILEAK